MSPTSSAVVQAPGKVWLVTSATSPLGFSIARQALRNGDSVVAGCSAEEYTAFRDFKPPDGNATANNAKARQKRDADDVPALGIGILSRLGGPQCLPVTLNTKTVTSCQAALAHAISTFGRVDILLNCTSHTYYGALGECDDWHAREQFEVSYFGTINIAKTVVKDMREKGTGGHIICVTSLAAQTGTPGLSLLTAAHHAVEGFMEALAFEIAPFNIKLTNVEPSIMTYLLTNPVHLPREAPDDGEEPVNEEKNTEGDEDCDDEDEEEHLTPRMGAANLRKMLESVTLQSDSEDNNAPAGSDRETSTSEITTPLPRVLRYPGINPTMQLEMVAETVKVIMAVAGKDNPPGRIIVGGEEGGEDGEGGVQSVKERMKAVSEELEEFLESSMDVDVPNAVVDDQADEGNLFQV
ncbi:hypothetical protein H072_5426 [Dactylellina haptotyla CBS 200.50]|uniref:Uncharacterized protein n=1 Tax=Dactylellina haptotyla (strain CBS 200.50) TaxID=1284197 RepID=S8BMJ4_DACHA|nr:hypothetical protein H072_5426 [Dactylellina haptotyla CBS 200.50]